MYIQIKIFTQGKKKSFPQVYGYFMEISINIRNITDTFEYCRYLTDIPIRNIIHPVIHIEILKYR